MHASDRSTARLVGWLFLGTFAFSIPGFLLYGPLLDDPGYALGGGHDTQIAAGAFLEILTVLCNVGTAVVLYPVARRFSPRLGLGYVASRVIESTIIAVGIVSVLAVVTLRGQSAGADPESLTVVGQSLVAIHDWTFLLGPAFCAGIGNGLILGFLMLRSGLLPRRLGLFGITAGVFAFAAASGTLFGIYEQNSTAQFLLTGPEMIWELTFGVYLIRRGFRSESAQSAAAAASSAPSATSSIQPATATVS
jgi:hypothetical protein